MKRFFLLLIFVIIFFTIQSIAQLNIIWDRSDDNFRFQRLCAPGKLSVATIKDREHLIDLTNGEIIFTALPFVRTNYWGDKFYAYEKNYLYEYDIKTKERIDIVVGIPENSDSSMIYMSTNHSIIIKNGNTAELLDSFKIPNTPNNFTYTTIYPSFVTSNDARFVVIHLQKTSNSEATIFLIFDRESREIIMEKKIPINVKFPFSFFNTKNYIAYAEYKKLPEDDKPYSYICIYDLENRELIKNLKIFDYDMQYNSFITLRQDDKIFAYGNGENNDILFFDLENNKKFEYKIPAFDYPIYLDNSLYISSSYIGYIIDWNLVSVDNKASKSSVNLNINYQNGLLRIMDYEAISPNITLSISDISGKILYNQTVSASNRIKIPINLINGTYLLHIQDGENSYSDKFLVVE